MKPDVQILTEAAALRNQRELHQPRTIIQEAGAAWLNSEPLGAPVQGVVLSTDGTTKDDVSVTGATYVVCWYGGVCIAVYYTAAAEHLAVLAAIGKGEPQPGDEDWDGVLPGLD